LGDLGIERRIIFKKKGYYMNGMCLYDWIKLAPVWSYEYSNEPFGLNIMWDQISNCLSRETPLHVVGKKLRRFGGIYHL
jgi:hypothetical protein